jgi:two-component system C4-dicarboxylate transport sensor histidine kinase DctB
VKAIDLLGAREAPGDDLVAEVGLLTPGLIHELRQPLFGIKAGLALVAASLGPQVTALEEWSMTADQIARLEEILSSWQQLFAPDEAPMAEFPAAPVVRRAAQLLRFRLRRLGDRFGVGADLPEAVAYGTPTHLLHALVNLLGNAIDAVDERGEGRVEVRIVAAPGARRGAGGCEVRVSDEGCGVPPDVRERIFEARFTTKGDRGSGLGLHIARRAMQASGGDVSIVADGDPLRARWARTEFAVRFGRPGERP